MKNPGLSILFLFIMILGEAFFLKLSTRSGAAADFNQLIIAGFIVTFGLILFIAFIKLFFNLFERNDKFQNLVASKEFWYKCIKGGFIIWVIMIIVIGSDQLFI